MYICSVSPFSSVIGPNLIYHQLFVLQVLKGTTEDITDFNKKQTHPQFTNGGAYFERHDILRGVLRTDLFLTLQELVL